MRKYTVLLLYPDYLADQYGQDTFLAWVKAKDATAAVAKAQAQACRANSLDAESAADFHPLFITTGFKADLTAR